MITVRSIISRFPKKAFVSLALVSIAFLASASMGGGGNKETKAKPVKGAEFTPIRTLNGFTLKAGPSYHGSLLFSQQKENNAVLFNSLVTFQKGNTTYILPYRYKLQKGTFDMRSNMQLLNFKLNIHK